MPPAALLPWTAEESEMDCRPLPRPRRRGSCWDPSYGPKHLEPVCRSSQRVDRVLRMRHQPDHVAGRATHPGDVPGGAVRVLPRRVAVGDLALRLKLVEQLVRRPEASFPVLGRNREPLAVRIDQIHLAAAEAKVLVEQQRAGKQAGLAEDLKAVADAEHRAAARGELGK